jgi:transcription antitermination factor NusG
MTMLEKAVAVPDYVRRHKACSTVEVVGVKTEHSVKATPAKWYALAVKPRHEKVVASTLTTKGFQTFLPLYTKHHEYARCRKDTELPLFPGYVFCCFNALTRLPILTTPGVTQILGIGKTPIPLVEAEIISLQIAVEAAIGLRPFPFPQVGQKVRINEGALAGVEGVVISIKQCLRLVLSITLLQRSVLLEIDSHMIRW